MLGDTVVKSCSHCARICADPRGPARIRCNRTRRNSHYTRAKLWYPCEDVANMSRGNQACRTSRTRILQGW